MKKHIPALCVVVFLVALVGIPILHNALSRASGVPTNPANLNGTTTGSANLNNTPIGSANLNGTTTSSANLNGTTPTNAPMSFVRACPPAPAGFARCMAMVSTTTVQPTFAAPAVTTGGVAAPAAIAPGSAAPYSPTALHNAYNLPTTAATAQTVAIIDAFDDPNAEADMATYRTMFGLPPCTTANGCFKKVNQTGGTTLPMANTSWGLETSLDLDMVSAICQNCHILLVEATSPLVTDLGAATNEAAILGANEISNSYGAPEMAGQSALCTSFYNHPGIAVTASSGDGGLGILSPATCPNVTGVGGTTLNSNGTETAWNTSATSGAGGGCSTLITIPTWEIKTVTNCANRSVSDVSAVADPNTGVLVIDTFGQGGPVQVGGTSASAPIIAATFALAGGTTGMVSSAIVPWTKSNTGCLNKVAGLAYAFQTGLGSPKGITCF